MEPRHHLALGRHQHRALRFDRPVRGIGDGPLRPATHPARGDCAASRRGRALNAYARRMAAHALLGCARWCGHRRHLDGARRDCRDPVVRRAAGPGARRVVGGERDRSACVSADARANHRIQRMAKRDDARCGSGRRGFLDRAAVHARSSRRHRASPVRPARRRSIGRPCEIAGADRGAAPRNGIARVLDSGRHVLRVRRKHQRIDRDALDRRATTSAFPRCERHNCSP